MSVSVPPSASTSRLAFPGAIVAGKYRLEEVVGTGGMGSVWRATHMGLGGQVAIKLVSAIFVRSAEALRRFDTEAKAAARIQSRHVPQVFDNGVLEDGTPYLVMELLHGESIAGRVNRLGPIPLPEVITILEQCCRALTRAHSLGIVHRDIKPENLYLAQSVDDDGYVAKVLDFGIAKVTPLTEDARTSTRTGTLLGTPLYMSPEQARGLRSIDFRTDLYSLGLVSYTMLTARLPFSGETLGELLLQICVEPLPSLRAAAPALPPATEYWFQKACARQPEDRHPSAQAFVEALRVAAGVSSPNQSDSVSGKRALQPPLSSTLDDASLQRGVAASGGILPVPSTTGGTSFGAPTGVSRRARWALIVASAILGLALAPIIVLLARRGGTTASAPTSQVTSSSAPVTVAPAREAGPGVSLAPLGTESASAAHPPPARPPTVLSPPALSSDKPTAAPWHPPVAHPATAVMPAQPAPKPTSSTRVTKPGGIDLGY
jgi:serine/threonine protein kinase